MQLLKCPTCGGTLSSDLRSAVCEGGHSFKVIDGIIDVMPETADQYILYEEKYWNEMADEGWPENIENLNPYMDTMMFNDYQNICSQFIATEWPDYRERDVCIGEIGCGNGSAIAYLENVAFSGVNYVGIDISMKMMQLARKRPLPANWNILFARTSGDNCMFRENYFDIIFSISVLHHFSLDNIFKCVSNSLKLNGFFVVNEPSEKNPFARVGRRFGNTYGIDGSFRNKKKKPLHPQHIREMASKYQARLVYEKGLHFLTWPLYYILLSVKPPKSLASICISCFQLC